MSKLNIAFQLIELCLGKRRNLVRQHFAEVCTWAAATKHQIRYPRPHRKLKQGYDPIYIPPEIRIIHTKKLFQLELKVCMAQPKDRNNRHFCL